VGHGSGHNGGANPGLLAQAAALRARGLFAEVRATALNGAPDPEAALAGIDSARVYLAPLFLCAGHSLRVALPRALGLDGPVTQRGGQRFVLCPPLGLMPGLTRLILARAANAARARGLDPEAAVLLLVGHGSLRNPASRRAAEWHASGARAAAVFGEVDIALLDEPPFLAEVMRRLTRPTIAVGLFADNNRHAGQDLPDAIARHAPVAVRYLGAIGTDVGIPDLVLDQVAATASPHAQTIRMEPVAARELCQVPGW
jgi:sirohydrochlorin cobaltochelatase